MLRPNLIYRSQFMKRFHVNLSVTDMDKSVDFYTALFSSEPTVRKPDYAKWMLEDPRVNFAISNHGSRDGLDHLGIQVEDGDELEEVHGRLKNAGGRMIEEGETTCCYANSEKNWIFDPDNLAWETFLTVGDSPVYGTDTLQNADGSSACCAPKATDSSSCC